jgi:hypothetical protein
MNLVKALLLSVKNKSKKLRFILQFSTAKLSVTISHPTPENEVDFTTLEALEVNTHHYMKESGVIKRMLELNDILCKASTYCDRQYKVYKKKSPQSTQSGVLEEGPDLLRNPLLQAWSMI